LLIIKGDVQQEGYRRTLAVVPAPFVTASTVNLAAAWGHGSFD
jgi:hypothetical protein